MKTAQIWEKYLPTCGKFLHFACWLAIFTLLVGCSIKQNSAPLQMPETHIFLADGSKSSMQTVVEKALGVQFILVGESHNNPHHHLVQAKILEGMVQSGVRPLVGLEMVDTSYQDVLTDFYHSRISLQDLEKNLNWPKTWGYSFAIYRPVFEIAQRYKLPLIALNLPRHVIKEVREQGFEQAKLTYQMFLPNEILPADQIQIEILQDFFAQHAKSIKSMGKASPTSFELFLQTQSLWDTTMATNAINAQQEWQKPILILAGSGHVEYGFGIARRLAYLAPEAGILLVTPIRSGELANLHRANLPQKNYPEQGNIQHKATRVEADNTATGMPLHYNDKPLPPLGDFLFYIDTGRKKPHKPLDR